jgi:ribosome recycling factor
MNGVEMADEGIEIDLENLEKRMDGALSSLRNEFLSLRTGRASASMLDPINMDSYGSLVSLSQCGTINVPDPRMITVNIWDKSLVSAAEKAIRDSGLGINPIIDGTIIRLPIPELNEERRRELTKLAATYAENARIAVRNVRRDGMDQIKKAKNSGMGEDDQKIWSDEIQEVTKAGINNIDSALETKQAEIMQV